MREILFRGKDIYGKWLYGDLITLTEDLKQICNHSQLEHAHGVDPETVGQYTGLTDKNGKKIFEGDIVKSLVIYNDRFRDSVKKETAVYEVKYHKEYCYFYLAREKNNLLFDGNWDYGVVGFEVIGTIHDNPELLEVDNG